MKNPLEIMHNGKTREENRNVTRDREHDKLRQRLVAVHYDKPLPEPHRHNNPYLR